MNIAEYLKKHPNIGRKRLAKVFGISDYQARKAIKNFKSKEYKKFEDQELLDHTVNLELKNQHLRDTQRIERKIRDDYRKTNHIKPLIEELINCVKNRPTPKTTFHKYKTEDEKVGIIQCSDFHLNEIIDIPSNKFDFHIATKRAEKFVHESIKYFKINNVTTVILAMTGDMINSDRRTDEKLSQVTSRSRACYLASLLLEQMILHLNDSFNVKVAFVVGNESRSFEVGRHDIIMSDNYDLTIVSLLKLIFRDTDVEFLDSNLVECILNVKNKNILLVHGEKIGNGKSMQKSIQEVKGKFTQSGVIIDFIIFGHIHECFNSDFYSRSSSLCGGNGFSDYDLNFSSRASQNIYIVDDWINSIKIDLQNTDDFIGYEIDEKLIDTINQTKDEYKVNIVKI